MHRKSTPRPSPSSPSSSSSVRSCVLCSDRRGVVAVESAWSGSWRQSSSVARSSEVPEMQSTAGAGEAVGENSAATCPLGFTAMDLSASVAVAVSAGEVRCDGRRMAEGSGRCDDEVPRLRAGCVPSGGAARARLRQRTVWLLVALLALVQLVPTVESCGPGRGIGGPRRTRKLLPLVFKQHVPNVSENSLSASGMQEGAISRNDSKFRNLETNYNKDIIFKDEEGTGADRVMTQRCKEKLNILAVSVMNQWPGLRLMVTEGWDEDHMHAPESLHYEGRAVDIMTSDKDRSKIGMLARLAVEAGFDWVFYESRNHIHCSVKSDSSQANHASGCFTGDSTVLTASGARRKLNELRIGERVQAVDASGQTVFSEVLMFMDRDTHQRREFVTIEAEGGALLQVTPAHLVMVWRRERSETRFVFADRVREGDHVLVQSGADGALEPRRVHRISAMLSEGVYAPLTREGTIVVDSVAASCYALIDSQTVAHLSFLPYRAAQKLGALFERSSAADSLSLPRHEGIHWYAKSLYAIKDYLIPSDWLYH
uniref:Hedgehog protein n=1 Tax=Anopheles atroparvus TaxID=41427 RepID=A0A8W7NZE1_ANOAO